MSVTNETTKKILEDLYRRDVFAWRQNTGGIPIHGKGGIEGFRPGGKRGIPDILGIQSTVCRECGTKGVFVGVEIKTGKDKLRPEQVGFHETARKLGAKILVVKDFEDFKDKW